MKPLKSLKYHLNESDTMQVEFVCIVVDQKALIHT